MLVKSSSLSLLRSSLLPATQFSKMKLNANHRQTTVPVAPFRILSRVFPFRLRYLGGGLGGSARPISCTKSHSRPSKPVQSRELSTRVGRDLDNRVHSGGISKSLIDDEAELSDWVSDLRTSSMRAGVFTDDEIDGDKGRGKKRGRDGDGFEGELGNYGGDRVGLRRNIGGDKGRGGSKGMDKIGRRGGNTGMRRETGLKHSRINRKFGSESEDDVEEDRSNAGRGDRSNAGRGRSDVQGRMGRGGRMGLGSRRGDNLPKSSGGEREFGARIGLRRGGGRGGVSQRDQSSRRRTGMVSDGDQTDDKSVSSFINLIGEDGSEDADEVDDEDNVELENRSRNSLFGQEERIESSPPSSPSKDSTYLSETRFDQCDISPLSLKATKDAGYEKMTMVQAATLPHILKGKDVMAKARTGTGKTVAFLLPSIEVVLKSTPADRDQRRPPILVLVICPTRELASQAATEANKLLKYHHSIGTQVVIGGTRLAVEQKRMQANPCQILVATPGRLRDHIENTPGFATRLGGVKVLVLDEADHLLDMGFRKDIERIITAVPSQRQTLLFSATIPNEVRQISHIALKRDYEYVNTVEEGSDDTHAKVRQMHLVAPLEKHFSMLYTILKDHVADDVNYKVLVFCTTAMVTKLVADLLSELNLNVREIHSRKPQSYRTRVSDEFRKSTGLILVTSDVSARGVDYPDVTLVIQLGVPADRHQYIHRLGRTGRKGKEGLGLLVLAQWEEYFLSSVKDLPISKAPVPAIDPEVEKKVAKALSHVEMKNKESAYQAWLGYYNSNKVVGKDKFRLVELANEFSRCMGLDRPPAIKKMVLGKMGLKNVPGLRSQ